jgi:hypothetical protein
LAASEESATAHEIERLRHDNVILHSGACPPSKQDHELQEVYYHLSDVKHGWNYTCMLLDITHEEVETNTHRIVHLGHHVEVQDAELKERAEMIADLEQLLLELQVQTPPEPFDH